MAEDFGTANSAKFYIDIVVRNANNIANQVSQQVNKNLSANVGGKGTEKAFSKTGHLLGSSMGAAIGAAVGAAIGTAAELGSKWGGKFAAAASKAGMQAMMPNIVKNVGSFMDKGLAHVPIKYKFFEGLKVKGLFKLTSGFGAIQKLSNHVLNNLSVISAKLIAVGIKFAALAIVLNRWGDFNEELNKTNILFREAKHVALGFADTIHKAYGTSKTQAMAIIGDIQNALVPFVTQTTLQSEKLNPKGIKSIREFSADKSITIAKRVMDIASLRNLNVDDVSTLMTSAIIRGGRAAQSLGAAMSQVEVEAKALEMSGKTRIKDLTVEEKQYARIEIIMARTADAQGDMMRTAGTIKNAWRNLKGTFGQTLTELGKIVDVLDIGGALLALANFLKLINQILAAIGAIAQVIKTIFRLGWDAINLFLTGIQYLLHKMGSGIADWFAKLGISMKKTKFFSNMADEFKSEYDVIVAKIRKLEEQQQKTKGVDNSAQIAFLEAYARQLATFLEIMGSPIIPLDPFTGLNDELEKTESLTNSIHNNLLKIGDDMQEALFKMDTDKVKIFDDSIANWGDWSKPAEDKTENKQASDIEVIKDESVKQTNYLVDLIRMIGITGVYF